MNIGEYIFLAFVWHFVGLILYCTFQTRPAKFAFGYECVNPCFLYKYGRVNAFGALVGALYYSLLMPIPVVCYWFYKLCTFGRKYDF